VYAYRETNNIVIQFLNVDMMKILKCVHNDKVLRLTDFTPRGVVVVLADLQRGEPRGLGWGAKSNLQNTENVCPVSDLVSLFWRRTAF